MEVPDLVEARLGDERPERAVSLGDGDAVFFTSSRTLLYRADGLLSDESIEVYGHDVERLDLSAGRRKTTVSLTYVGGTEQFSVPREYSDQVLEGLLAGILEARDVLAAGETVDSVYRFSELTLVVTEAQLVKHVGAPVWNTEYEVFPFAEVTGLEFEDSSVATQIVLWVNGHPQRIKAPSDEGRVFQQTLTERLCAFHDVDSLAQLNEVLASGHDETSDPPRDATSDIALDDTIAPLVSTPESDADTVESGPDKTGPDADAVESGQNDRSGNSTPPEQDELTTAEDTGDESGSHTAEEFEQLHRQLSELTTTVERQNRLLEQQQEAIAELADRLDGRDE
jgi:hypothetical protein